MTSKTLRALAVAAALFALPGLAQAQDPVPPTLGPTIAYHDDADFGVGIGFTIPLEAFGPQVGFAGDFIYFFPSIDNLKYWELNGNLTYDFQIEGASVAPFALAGLNVAHASVEVGSESAGNTELGLNVGGGIRFDAGSLRPTVGLRIEIEGGDGWVVFGSVPFALQE